MSTNYQFPIDVIHSAAGRRKIAPLPQVLSIYYQDKQVTVAQLHDLNDGAYVYELDGELETKRNEGLLDVALDYEIENRHTEDETLIVRSIRLFDIEQRPRTSHP